jgi:heavy metal translocating P-type ATPase
MSCTLCGLDSGVEAFCCAGCQNVYAILLESGVLASGVNFRETPLYRQSLKLGIISKPRPAEAPTFAAAETREAVFQLSGLWCTSCGWLIEHALAGLPGFASAEVHFASDLLKVRYAPQLLPQDRIAARVRSLGYQAAEYAGPGQRSSREQKDLLLRLGVAAFLWMNVMMLSAILYTSYFQSVSASFQRYLPALLMALSTPAVFWCAAPILRLAWAGARHGVLRMETLLALGILTTYGYSAAGNGAYYDTACAIVTLVLLGKSIERAAKDQASRALSLLHRLMPNKARLITDGRERFVSIEALKPGATFRVKPGERIPADGVVQEGRSHADESVLTGESGPRPKAPGDTVVCGSINIGNSLDIRATQVGAESTLARIVSTVEQACANRTSIERTVDRVSRLFIPAVLLIAIATFAYAGLSRAIAVLVIACPCALGIATPLALTAAVTTAGRRGILARDAGVLETIRAVDAVILDKTGTVTTGAFTLLEAAGDTSRMAELAAIEAHSSHPIAKAILARTGGAALPQATDVEQHPGIGITGTVAGARYFIGNRRLAGNSGLFPQPVLFGWDGEVRGGFSFGDPVRPDAASLCASLRTRGIRTVILSGDCAAVTRSVAETIGADEWISDATAGRKVETVREMQATGARVAMVGDGVNDAPSLAQANIGIAMGAGADLAMHAAPLVLMGNSLAAVTDTLDLARRAHRIVRQNLFWAFAYNVTGISLAVTGILNPIMAAGAMVLSSLSVIANSRRL